MDIWTEKKQIRQKIKLLVAGTREEYRNKAAAEVFGQIEKSPEFENSKCILLYWSFGNELPTHEVVIRWSKEKKILLPQIIGEEMVAAPFTGTENMRFVPPFGIGEPESPAIESTGDIDLIIVPGVAFDANGNRLGRGKAFYDRFLPKCNAFVIGVGYHFQLITNVPHDTNDVKMNLIVIP